MPPELKKVLTAFMETRKRPLLIMSLPTISVQAPLVLTDVLNSTEFNELDVLLISPGGDPDAAFQVANILRRHAKTLNIVVPLYAKSAGTLICLCADSILMTDLSELGPLDTQVTETKEKGVKKTASALNESKALEQVQYHCLTSLATATDWLIMKSNGTLSFADATELAIELTAKTAAKLYNNIDPMKVGKSSRDLAIGEKYATHILTRHQKMNEEQANNIANRLVNGYPSHGFVLDTIELENIGLPAVLLEGDEEKRLLDVRKKVLSNLRQPIIELMVLSEGGNNNEKKSSSKTQKTTN